MPKLTTRNAIFNYLTENPEATTESIARRFNLAPSTVRHHLLVLAEEGRISVSDNARVGERGRPFQQYAVTRRGEVDLMAMVLRQIISNNKFDGRVMEYVAEGLLEMVALPVVSGSNLTMRVLALVEALDRLGYKARWEVRSPSPVVIFGNCPYAKVGNQQQFMCQADVLMLTKALGREITQTRQYEMDEKGHHFCRFSVG